LIEIVRAHFPEAPEKLINAAVIRFLALRQQMQAEKRDIGKKVSTSELIDWFRVLKLYPQNEVLSKLNERVLYPSVLLKSEDDYSRFGLSALFEK
jgi:hypothetical protein